jgi:succinate-semialdehyde dehydrogenase/glutarate-semialdehyde dehydrogenase
MLKKTVLELDGSDPYVILEDANNRGRGPCQHQGPPGEFRPELHCGQAFYRRRGSAARVRGAICRTHEHHQDGRSARRDHHRQVEASTAGGARVLLGGAVPNNPGAYYPPTVLTNVRKGMPAYEEELFGPVAAIIPTRDEAEAIATANDTVFGLGGVVITRDLARGERIAEDDIESGTVFVNDAVQSDPRLPFGGVKESGYGRELSSYGIKEFVNVKTVVVA